ncbi:hypothetical protein M422DRAFT_245770 [Sphaerobolus stellatus SS14]|nr:hypothetical protein M422DRAFT_245770 [Sphaerobolus stellatus SS14]
MEFSFLKHFIGTKGIPPRPPSHLLPPGDHHIAVSLGEALGHGKVGSVYSVTVLTPGLDIPPLVIKVSNYKRSANMAEDAWYYEELEQLQGIAFQHGKIISITIIQGVQILAKKMQIVPTLILYFKFLVVWVIDMVLWWIARSCFRDVGASAQYGNANWLTLGVLIALILAFCAGAIGSCGNYRRRSAATPAATY